MKHKILPNIRNKKRVKLSLIASFVVALSIPIAVWTLATGSNFDTRNFAQNIQTAFEDKNYCKYRFTYVNGGSIEKDSVVQLEIEAQTEESDINSLIVKDQSGGNEQILFSKEYKDVQLKSVSEYFIYKAKNEGEKIFLGEMRFGDPEINRVCEYDPILQADNIRVAPTNVAPEFTTNPYTQSDPSTNIKVGDSYRYNLKAKDNDGDRIYYQSSFTPRADWLNYSVEQDGSGGNLSLKYQGIADQAASYLVNVFAHDGYNNHLRSQSWVINVDPKVNDNPIVKILTKLSGEVYKRGSVITIKWEATDQNLINTFKIFYATNPGDQNSWRLIDGNVSYRVNEYSIDSTTIPEGKYSIIVQAEDNQDPIGIGSAVEGPFEIIPLNPPIQPADPSEVPEDNTPDDGEVFDDPQVINLEPSDRSEIRDVRKTIKATLVAGKDAAVVKDTIKFELDGEDLTEELEISNRNNGEINIIYTPDNDLAQGEHSVIVNFADDKEREANKQWSFTVLGDESDEIVRPFGIEITKRTATIIGIGLLIILLALIVPWLLYLAWKNSDDNEAPTGPYDVAPVQGPPIVSTSAVKLSRDPDPKQNMVINNKVEQNPATPVIPTRNFNTGIDPQIVAVSQSENKSLPAAPVKIEQSRPTESIQPTSPSVQQPEVHNSQSTTVIPIESNNIETSKPASSVTTFNDITIKQDEKIMMNDPASQSPTQSAPEQSLPVISATPIAVKSKDIVEDAPLPVESNAQNTSTDTIPEYKDMTMSSLESLAQAIEDRDAKNPYNYLSEEEKAKVADANKPSDTDPQNTPTS